MNGVHFEAAVTSLPVFDVLDELKALLISADELVLQAPPGAGKTTIVPLALLDQSWLGKQKILMLEPRRMAARATAGRMAQLLGENVGQTVGYRIRLDSCVSRQTRIEVITEGILTRRLQSDPSLEGVGLVIFDEFHERNLNSDLGLALTLQARELLREEQALKILVMSATLDTKGVSKLLGDTQVLTSAGRQYPVQTIFGAAHKLRESIIAPTLVSILQALEAQQGSILVFLPGQSEIRRVAAELTKRLHSEDDVLIAPLYGGLNQQQQQQAIMPPPVGKRKVVLATNIAETSLTIEGIDTVIDSGLVREPVFSSASGMTRLATRRVSLASAEQRRGRAGRLRPGTCYRLWSEEQHERLVAHSTPEILQADLTPMVLQLLAWGIDDPADLRWLDAPPAGPYTQALSVLKSCGAATKKSNGRMQVSPHGVRLAKMPLHPRLAHMLSVAADMGHSQTACVLAAVLSERNPLAEHGVNLGLAVAVLQGAKPCPGELRGWYKRTWQQARTYLGSLPGGADNIEQDPAIPVGQLLAMLLAAAYPDRIARRRAGGANGQYKLSNGRGAELSLSDPLSLSEWLVVAELGGHSDASIDRIYAAVELDPELLNNDLLPMLEVRDLVVWDIKAGRLRAERSQCVGDIVYSLESVADVPEALHLQALLVGLRKTGLDLLPWTEELRQWCARVTLLRKTDQRDTSAGVCAAIIWPDLSPEGLLETMEQWLAPYLGKVRSKEDFKALNLRLILGAMLPWPASLELERLAPARFAVPSGSNVSIDYRQSPPVLAVKLQEMFGCDTTPRIAAGRIALVIHLLSPAGRPLQVTQDLAGFWRGGYEQVKKEMKGRYPKHPWPDDPLKAPATRHTKGRAPKRG